MHYRSAYRKMGNGYLITEAESAAAQAIKNRPSRYMHAGGGEAKEISKDMTKIVLAIRDKDSIIRWRSPLVSMLIRDINQRRRDLKALEGRHNNSIRMTKLNYENTISKLEDKVERLADQLAASYQPPQVIPDCNNPAYQKAANANLAVMRLHTKEKRGVRVICQHCQATYPCETRLVIEGAMK